VVNGKTGELMGIEEEKEMYVKSYHPKPMLIPE
jgi:hypothetical protein